MCTAGLGPKWYTGELYFSKLRDCGDYLRFRPSRRRYAIIWNGLKQRTVKLSELEIDFLFTNGRLPTGPKASTIPWNS